MSDTITYLPRSAIREHPDNPRKHYDPADLQGLADSIQAQGLMQPVVVRPLPGAADTDTVRYELVFGHRRLRALQLLPDYDDDGPVGLRVQAIVRAMNDVEAALAQTVENLQRQGITPLEEADNLVRLHRAHGMTAEQIATQIGMSRSFVYGKIKLSRACDAVRHAVTAEGLSPETALEVARLHPKVQPLGLKRLRSYNDEWLSQRAAKNMLRTLLQEHQLGNAAFDPTDAELTRCASACTHCHHRAGNDPDLVAEHIPADACINPECFDAKQRAHTLKTLPVLRAQGLSVITADEASEMKLYPSPRSEPAGHRCVDYTHMAVGYDAEGEYQHRNLAEALADLHAAGVTMAEPKRVVIANPHTGTHDTYITDQDARAVASAWRNMMDLARAAASAASTPSTAARAAGGEAARPDPLSDWTGPERAFAAYDSARRVLGAVIDAMVRRPRTAEDLRLVLLGELTARDTLSGLVFDRLGLTTELRAAEDHADEAEEDWDETRWWMDRLATLSADVLAQLVVGIGLEYLLDNVYAHSAGARASAARAAAIAASFGVDVVEAATQPSQTDNAGAAGDEQLDCAGGAAAGGYSMAGAQLDLVGR